MIAVLGAVSTLCGLIIVLVYTVTAPAIQNNLAAITNAAIRDIIPEADRIDVYEIDPSGAIRKPATTGNDRPLSPAKTGNSAPSLEGIKGDLPKIFPCYDASGKLAGVACKASGRGYAGVISVLYAYSPDQQAITGLTVLSSNETPGLGSKICDDSDFLANFEELEVKLNAQNDGLEHAITTVKHGAKSNPWEIDAISGATISSKAVGKLLNASAQQRIPLIQRYRGQLRENQ